MRTYTLEQRLIIGKKHERVRRMQAERRERILREFIALKGIDPDSVIAHYKGRVK